MHLTNKIRATTAVLQRETVSLTKLLLDGEESFLPNGQTDKQQTSDLLSNSINNDHRSKI
jgi:hypothetical protein